MKIPKIMSSPGPSSHEKPAQQELPALYGLPGITHGSGHILHLLSPEGAEAVTSLLSGRQDLRLLNPGMSIPCFLELKDGTFDALARELGIRILTKQEWDERKAELNP